MFSASSVFGTISGILAATIITILFFHSFHSVRHTELTVNKYYLALYFLSLLFFFIFDIITVFINTYSTSFDNEYLCDIYFNSYAVYSAGKCFMIVFLTFRVYVIFGRSIQNNFRRKNCILIIVSIVLFHVCIMIGFLVHMRNHIWYKKYHQSNENLEIISFDDCLAIEAFNSDVIFYILVAIAFSGEVVFSIIVLRLYIRRLLGLAKNLNKILNIQSIAANSNSIAGATVMKNTTSPVISPSLNRRITPVCEYIEDSLEFIDLAAKATNLVIFSIISSIIASVVYDIFGRWIFPINTLVNCLCMYLTFSFGKRMYYILCEKCACKLHYCCLNICVLKYFACCDWGCCEFECEIYKCQCCNVENHDSIPKKGEIVLNNSESQTNAI